MAHIVWIMSLHHSKREAPAGWESVDSIVEALLVSLAVSELILNSINSIPTVPLAAFIETSQAEMSLKQQQRACHKQPLVSGYPFEHFGAQPGRKFN